ncbi:phosphoenolpyruvate--protein phosphotransferase [Paenibacillus macerans]|uniref:Phosphoenolpyruvate-protein phosphotransferase n=1 Tax=Paenibacillus macerans TaxID=44252 RepID=A0A090ZEK9_PAEMA|nr:phosphoenolpyruvate--protein phosphotransferase [Paenibacillus macerans]KFN09759.1 phosphoenolpyruvate-protein kinase [Paenibacillus macerans]MCY7559786.1 phosphoenolpyruvate--protein phosphotransferase [Paenibacillus macerans]MEC0155201.1 phosphoenolpyruvate--protein phosphotransferase [Paenibacillus macerans]MUG22548.1 phosphoenolpyruvate--protein phosphotransferase [Paenibacillus macerans]UMV46865.1 phosphoenolpyruvate--protein phosphotransferase [Paenibacillus macerans]
MIQGIGAAAGVAIGKAFVLPAWEWDVPDRRMDKVDLAMEFERLYEGIRTSKTEIEGLKNEIKETVGAEESGIFDAHLAILEDPVFMSEIRGIIERQYKAAEVAVKEAIDHFVTMFDLLDDEYMKERALDIKDVGNRLLKHLLGTPDITLPADTQPYILVAKELSPSQLVHLNPDNVLGMVTMAGGKTSHSAIMARALGIPLVSGLEHKLAEPVQTGDLLVIDGDEGQVYLNPGPDIVKRYTEIAEKQRRRKEQLQLLAAVEAVTKDGVRLRLAGNISSVKDLELAVKYGAEGVGLFRTEFLYMDRASFPGEDEQFEVYRQVAEKAGAHSVVIRTLDIGGDKQLEYFELPEEDNPVLGYRAIRISLDSKELFQTQLTAILRASAYGNVKILYPMISSLEEIRAANRILEAAKQDLRTRGLRFDPGVQVGVMIEVPAAAAIADLLAQEADFFSIGTNDLVQYVLAVDRMNEKIAHMYHPYHPAVLRMLKQTVQAAKEAGIPVSVCGEMAGDEKAVPLWLHLGVSDLSMSPQSLLRVKHRILNSYAGESREAGAACYRLPTSYQIEAELVRFGCRLEQERLGK